MSCLKKGLITSVLLFSAASHAAVITQNGDDVSFTYDDSTLYGTGVVFGNSIFFTPPAFLAQSVDGAGIDTATANLNIDVVATTSGFNMSSFSLFEDGDYKLDGGSASAEGFFRATSLTTGCGLPPCQITDLFDTGALADTGGVLDLWNINSSLDLSNVPGWGSDTEVRLTVQNILTAETTASGENAFIQKKFSITIPQIPVPAAVWLFGSGLIGLIGIARRKKA